MSRLLGIDLGERRIGLAVGDTASATTRALATIARGSPDRDAYTLSRIIAEQRIDALVVGLPLLPGGSEGAQARATRTWVGGVLAGLGRPWSFQDERGTSLAAEAGLGRAPRGRSGGVPSPAARQRRRSLIDREAARRIVQAGMDAGLGAPP
ncbi:MAG: Holliday junction resolvase RuvX [Candidatus Limnocylindrales bacterium]